MMEISENTVIMHVCGFHDQCINLGVTNSQSTWWSIFWGSLTGDFLPMQVVYKGKTEKILLQVWLSDWVEY